MLPSMCSGGPLERARAVLTLTESAINSYCSLLSGFEAPLNLAYFQSNHSATTHNPRLGDELRCQAHRILYLGQANHPYFALTGQLMTDIPSITNRIGLGQPVATMIRSSPPPSC